MAKTLYVFSSSTLKRKDNNLVLQVRDCPVQYLPIENVEEILIMGDVELNKSLLELLCDQGIVVHFFDYFGGYVGTYSPPESKNSGQVFLAQAAYWLDEYKRHKLAATFVIGAIANMIKLISNYQKRYENINANEIVEYLRYCLEKAPDTSDINSLMGIEGTARNAYYQFFDLLIQNEFFKIRKRVRRPPDNPMNALISFINSICYSMTLTEIYKTHLDPRISFLHSPSDRRISLNLDISEIFKPLIVDRLIFSLVNNRMLKPENFESVENGGIYVNEDARKIIVELWDKSLRRTITYPSTGQKMGWRRVVRNEAYKIQSCITEGTHYEPFIYKW